MPSAILSPQIRSTYSDVQFADPSFDRPGRIDFLLGADLYNRIFEKGYQIRHEVSLPSSFETILGWIFVGTASQVVSPSSRVCLKLSLEPSLHQLLHRFWACEEPVVQSIPFTEEEKCEDIFRRTTMRDSTGRYIVSFPFKMDPSVLGDSRTMAVSRFLNLERKLQGDPDVYSEYRLFMHEYLTLGHMKIASTLGKYIIPHHAVVKYVNNKIKLRVVVDASARTSSGVFKWHVIRRAKTPV
jgi:ribosomal protein L32